MDRSDSKITLSQFAEMSANRLPFAESMGMRLESISRDCAVMRAIYRDDFLRPGGTIAGPVMMGLADAVMYALVLANVGPVELAVTTNLNINFMRKPPPGDLLARATPLKIGKRLAIGQIALYGEQSADTVVAHATATYSIPPAVT